MKEITAYICEHCEKKIYRSSSSAQGHEKRCYWNPENKACASCDYQIFCHRETSPGHVKSSVMCAVTGENLLDKSKLRRGCESWIQREIF